MNGFLNITTVKVPQHAICEIHQYLQSVGTRGYEGLGLLAGRQHDDEFVVTQAVIPSQQLLHTAQGVGLLIPPAALHELNVWLYDGQLSVIAQVHSHPTEAFHSDTDDEFPVATVAGAFSIVIPDFAERPFSLTACAVYRLTANALWRPMSIDEVTKIFVITK